jgi:hypothetical protein
MFLKKFLLMDKYCVEFIEKLKKYKKIIITGAQRSGTRFVTNALANDLSYDVVDEVDYEISDFNRFIKTIDNNENIVIQAPALTNRLLDIKTTDTLVIFLKRNIDDILRSQQKSKGANGASWYNLHNNILTKKAKNYFKNNKNINWGENIAIITYEIWEKLQKNQMSVDYIEVTYESFNTHPMFLKKDKRKNFKIDQIK